MWNSIRQKINEHTFMSGIERDESRINATAEFFTPTDLVIEMLQKTDLNIFGPKKTVLDPACGDGQFLVAIKFVKMLYHKMSEQDALDDIYGVDIMRDNVDMCKKRLNGGHIVLGNSLNPFKKLEEQTHEEHLKMIFMFSSQNSVYVD